MRNKKIQILLVFVLAIGLFGLLFYWRYGEKKQMEIHLTNLFVLLEKNQIRLRSLFSSGLLQKVTSSGE